MVEGEAVAIAQPFRRSDTARLPRFVGRQGRLGRAATALVSFTAARLLHGGQTVASDFVAGSPDAPRYRLTIVYLLGTLTMFGTSALYHRGRTDRQARGRRLDHCDLP
jgi:predicted membrane channel-forming protein YqfA (hemolysin III family)